MKLPAELFILHNASRIAWLINSYSFFATNPDIVWHVWECHDLVLILDYVLILKPCAELLTGTSVKVDKPSHYLLVDLAHLSQ